MPDMTDKTEPDEVSHDADTHAPAAQDAPAGGARRCRRRGCRRCRRRTGQANRLTPAPAAPAPAAPAKAEAAKKDEPKKPEEESWVETVKTIVYALLIALVIRTFLFQPFNIPSGSMENTLLIGDYLFVEKYAYGYSRYSFPWGLGPLGDGWHGRIFASHAQARRRGRVQAAAAIRRSTTSSA